MGTTDIHFFVPDKNYGVRLTPQHDPELLPVTRPEASRRVLGTVPLPWVLSLPVMRPEASRNWVQLPANWSCRW